MKYRKCNTHCQSQSMHVDTSLGQGVFHGWFPLPLQNPKEPQKITKKILTAAQQIPGGQRYGWFQRSGGKKSSPLEEGVWTTPRPSFNGGLTSSKGPIHMSPANRCINSPFFMDSALLLWEKQTNPQQIGGPHGVYKPVRGRDVTQPPLWDDDVGPLMLHGFRHPLVSLLSVCPSEI